MTLPLLWTRPNGIDKSSSLIEESLDEGGENGATSPEPCPEIPEITVTPPPQTGFSENLAETEGMADIRTRILREFVDFVDFAKLPILVSIPDPSFTRIIQIRFSTKLAGLLPPIKN